MFNYANHITCDNNGTDVSTDRCRLSLILMFLLHRQKNQDVSRSYVNILKLSFKQNIKQTYRGDDDDEDDPFEVRLGPYQRLWLYNGAPLIAFYDTLGIRRTYSRLKPPASSRGFPFERSILLCLNFLISNHKFPVFKNTKSSNKIAGRKK